jgi:hypothetical protein
MIVVVAVVVPTRFDVFELNRITESDALSALYLHQFLVELSLDDRCSPKLIEHVVGLLVEARVVLALHRLELLLDDQIVRALESVLEQKAFSVFALRAVLVLNRDLPQAVVES